MSRLKVSLLLFFGVWSAVLVSAALSRSQNLRIMHGLLGLAGIGGLLFLLRDAHAREKHEGDLEAQGALLKVTLQSIGDALITTDAHGRVVFMNPVAETLTGWSAAEAAGSPLETAFRIIHETTREPAFNPVARVLREGVVLGLANHTALISRAGKTIPIEDSAAPIKDSAGAVIGMVLVFHDVTEKRRAEEELAASERRFRNLTELSPSAIWINRNEHIEHANPESHRLVGAAAGQLAGKSIYELWHPDSHEKVRARLKAVADGQVVRLSEETMVQFDGSLRQVEVSSAPFEDVKGPAVQCVIRDVTERVAILEGLRRSEEGYRTLFNSMIEGFGIIDVLFDAEGRPVDFRFLEVNPAFEAQTGLANARGRCMRELAPDNEAHWAEIYGKVAVTGEAVRFVNEARALNRWYDVHAYRVGGAGSSKVAILFSDISVARRAEEAMRESEERFRNLADAIPQLSWMADGDGWIFWYNQRWYEYTGTTPEQMEGWGWQSVHDPAVLPEVMQKWQASIATGRPFDMVFPLRGRDGSFRPFLTRVMPVADENGKVQRWFGTNTDISERIQAEEERMRMEERTTQAQRLESLGVLVAGIAHNFNNILTVIMGTASLQEDLATGAGEQEALKVIVTACERGRGLVSSLTHFARPTLARQTALEVNQLVAEVTGLVANTVRKRIEIIEEYATEPVWISGDPGSLGSVFMNLCLNSLDAMPDGGVLTIRTSAPRPGWVEVAVQDSGEGMTPEVLAHATEPFFTTKPVDKGTGLGLSMAHGVAKAHGGTLDITSAPGKGTQVRVQLPRLAVPEPEAPAPGQPRSRMPMKVLLVDDEEDVRILMTRMLRKAGVAQVQTAPGGREALDLLGSGAVPDLVILDQNMPGLDGLQTLAQIRLAHPGLPVLIASGQPGIQEWDAYRQANVAVISKPFSLEEIEIKLAGMG